MATTNNIQNNISTPADGATDRAAAEAAGQLQLSFFDTVPAPDMNIENKDPIGLEQTQANTVEAEVASPTVSDELPLSTPVQELRITDVVAADLASDEIVADESLGQRLRAAREVRGMRCEDVAQQLRLPLATVQALEGDRYDRIGQGIYLRGYLSKYLTLLDLPQVLAERVLPSTVELPPLTTSGTVSRPRYLFQRYSVSALYLILTGVIIVPAVLLAMRAGFEPNLAQIMPLDTPESTAPAVSPSSTPTNNNVVPDSSVEGIVAAAQPQVSKPVMDETPLVASLAPFPTIRHEADSEVADKAPATTAGQHSLRLNLVEPSWVEIVASDGEKIEYGLLPAGTVRSYNSDKLMDVRLGNVNRATVEIDGKPQDLTAFRHANVAHFKVSDGEIKISPSGT